MTAAKPPRPAHLAHGRWLSDFPRPSAAERDLIAKCAAGEFCVLGGGTRPSAATTANTIRGGLIRFLLLGGDETHPTHENGVRLVGAWISDTLALESVRAVADLQLIDCFIAEQVIARDAKLTGFALRRCQLPGLRADRIAVSGSVFLDGGFTATGEVRLSGGQIGGNLECGDGIFCNADKDGKPLGNALSADGLVVRGDVFLNHGFTATGHVRLLGAQIGGDLTCTGGTFSNVAQDGYPLNRALSADRMVVKGGIFLNGGFTAMGEVRLPGAQIGGNLACSGGTFTNTDKDGKPLGDALTADRMVVTGSIFLDDGFTAMGEVRLLGAQVGGAIYADDGTFCNAGKDGKPLGAALGADGMVVTGGVFLNNGFIATGSVRLLGAQIGGGFNCTGGTFKNATKDGKLLGDALNADGMVVTDGLFMRRGKFVGLVNLTAAHAGSLVDDGACWPNESLILDGFHYDRISASSTDAAMRIGWLEKQWPAHLGADFRPQPWEQLIKVLREMGHPTEAAEVAMAKQRALRKAGKIGQRRPDPRYAGLHLRLDRIWVAGANLFARGWHWIYGRLAGYGHRPAGILMWMAVICSLSGWYFSVAADKGIMAPTSVEVFSHKHMHADLQALREDTTSCGIQREVAPTHYWPVCTELPSEYTTFNPWWYSIDLILPLVDLQQDTQWAPAATYADAGGTVRTLPGGVVARIIVWFEILFGWFASLMFVAIASRLVEKD